MLLPDLHSGAAPGPSRRGGALSRRIWTSRFSTFESTSFDGNRQPPASFLRASMSRLSMLLSSTNASFVKEVEWNVQATFWVRGSCAACRDGQDVNAGLVQTTHCCHAELANFQSASGPDPSDYKVPRAAEGGLRRSRKVDVGTIPMRLTLRNLAVWHVLASEKQRSRAHRTPRIGQTDACAVQAPGSRFA